MEKRAREFLDIAERYYERNKVKWESLIRSTGLRFDEDVYNDTIIKVYERISRDEDYELKGDDEIIAYWYRSFVNNLKRDIKYSKNSKRDDSDVIEILKDEEYQVENHHLYFATIRLLLNRIKEEYDARSYHIFKMYYLCPDLTYEELSDIVGYDVKSKISRMRNWLRDNVEQGN